MSLNRKALLWLVLVYSLLENLLPKDKLSYSGYSGTWVPRYSAIIFLKKFYLLTSIERYRSDEIYRDKEALLGNLKISRKKNGYLTSKLI